MKIDDLQPGTLYQLSVGKQHTFVRTLGDERIPPPTNLSYIELDHELEISWDPPELIDRISSYIIRHEGRLIGEVKDPHANCTVLSKVAGKVTIQAKGILITSIQ